jgi:hypothetical protein
MGIEDAPKQIETEGGSLLDRALRSKEWVPSPPSRIREGNIMGLWEITP